MGLLNPKPRQKVNMCYKTTRDSEISSSDFTTHKINRFTEEDDVGCYMQPLQPNDFVQLKFITKKTVKYCRGDPRNEV